MSIDERAAENMREIIGSWSANMRKRMREQKPYCKHGQPGWICGHPDLQFSRPMRFVLRHLFPKRGTRPRCVLDPVHGTDGVPQCLYQERP